MKGMNSELLLALLILRLGDRVVSTSTCGTMQMTIEILDAVDLQALERVFEMAGGNIASVETRVTNREGDTTVRDLDANPTSTITTALPTTRHTSVTTTPTTKASTLPTATTMTIITVATTTVLKSHAATTSKAYKLTGCNVSQILFPRTGHLDYVQYADTLPNITSLTVCVWLRKVHDRNPVYGFLVSYRINRHHSYSDMTIYLVGRTLRVAVPGQRPMFLILPEIIYETHMCISMSQSWTTSYVNGTLTTRDLTGMKSIRGGGVLVVGQNHPSSERSHGFLGEMTGFQLWNKALDATEIEHLYGAGQCNCADDAIFTLNSSNSYATSGVIVDRNVICHGG